MIGKIFITSCGYDPQLGKHVKETPISGQTQHWGLAGRTYERR
jgi:hypothetical protein